MSYCTDMHVIKRRFNALEQNYSVKADSYSSSQERTDGSLPFSQHLATGLYPEPNYFGPHPKYFSCIGLPSMSASPKWSLCLQVEADGYSFVYFTNLYHERCMACTYYFAWFKLYLPRTQNNFTCKTIHEEKIEQEILKLRVVWLITTRHAASY
jgi:hypothetical protein